MDEPVVDATVVEGDEGAAGELEQAVQEHLDSNAALIVTDPQDRQEALVAMDAHDIDLLVADITKQVQRAALRQWVYELPDAQRSKGLTVHAVQDITQRMNWTGKCAIGVLPETLTVEKEEALTEDGPQTFFVATIFAQDKATGGVQPGTSAEPQMMKLRAANAEKKRKEGKPIPEDNRVFDVFARTKAIAKATRNAMGAFIPKEVEQTVIAMASRKPELVERIQTEAEAKVSELPAPLDTPAARKLIAELGEMYDRIRDLGGGKGKVRLTPAQYNAYLVQSQHSMELLGRMRDWLTQRGEEIAEEFAK